MVWAPAKLFHGAVEGGGIELFPSAAIDLAEASQKPWKMTLDFEVSRACSRNCCRRSP